MPDREKVDWSVPTGPWERFRQSLRDEFGTLDGYLGYEAERAMREYLDDDRYAELEERVDDLVRACGRTPEGDVGEKNNSDSEATGRAQFRVHEEVRDDFRSLAKDTETNVGRLLGRALDVYVGGGRADRLLDKLDRVHDDAKAMLSELHDTDDGMSAVERRTVAICTELTDLFHDEDLNEAIRDHAGQSDPTIQEYRERVIDRLDYEPHPNNPDLWLSASKAAKIAPDVPAVCRQHVDHLSREERVKRVQYELGRLGTSRTSGKARVPLRRIRNEVLDEAVSKSQTIDIAGDVADTPGFGLDTSTDESTLVFNGVELRSVAQIDNTSNEADLLREIAKYRDEAGDDYRLLGDTTTPTVSDFSGGPAQARADGGTEDD